ALLEQLDPTTEARERRAELVRRLARHAGPDALARDVAAHTNDIKADDQQNRRGGDLQYGNNAQAFDERRVTEVNLAEHRIDERRILGIETANIRAQPRVLGHVGDLERQIRGGRRIPGRVRDDDRHALLDDAAR